MPQLIVRNETKNKHSGTEREKTSISRELHTQKIRKRRVVTYGYFTQGRIQLFVRLLESGGEGGHAY